MTRAAQSDFVPGSAFSAPELCLWNKKQARRVSYPTYPPISYSRTEARPGPKLWKAISQKFLVRILNKCPILSEKGQKFLPKSKKKNWKKCETVKSHLNENPLGVNKYKLVRYFLFGRNNCTNTLLNFSIEKRTGLRMC